MSIGRTRVSAPERSPLDGHLVPGPRGRAGEAGVRLRELRAGLVEVTARRGQESVLDAALRRELGVGLPAQGRACGSGDVAALWIAPATLLIVAVPERLAPLFRNVAPSVAAVVDQSGGFVLLCLEGPMVIAA